jgi:hypothetical protein
VKLPVIFGSLAAAAEIRRGPRKFPSTPDLAFQKYSYLNPRRYSGGNTCIRNTNVPFLRRLRKFLATISVRFALSHLRAFAIPSAVACQYPRPSRYPRFLPCLIRFIRAIRGSFLGSGKAGLC